MSDEERDDDSHDYENGDRGENGGSDASGHAYHAHQDGHEHDDDEHAGDEENGDGGQGEHDGHGSHGHDHAHHASDVETVGAAILTISSSRSLDDDPAGDTIAEAAERAGHEVSTRELVADEYDNVQAAVDSLVDREDTDVVVTAGGTGVTPDDVTIEAVEPLFKKELPGFGELFRRRSYGEVGARIVATRASAGVVSDVPVFCLPGSQNAARLGAEIVTEVCGHLAGLAKRADESK